MQIDHNELEIAAMAEFHKGNDEAGYRMQREFVAEFREAYKNKDHCPCTVACEWHGDCRTCVAVHRAHQEHVPNCMHDLLNAKIRLLSELTENSIVDELAQKK